MAVPLPIMGLLPSNLSPRPPNAISIIECHQERRSLRRNLSINETAAIDKLRTRSEIVIKPADKGGAVVIINTSDYVDEAQGQFADDTFYGRVDSNPTQEFKAIIKNILTSLSETKMISLNLVQSLLSPVAGRFYLLPKIHKKDPQTLSTAWRKPRISGLNV